MTLKELLGVMKGSKYGNYPLVHIEDWGTESDVAGDFGYVDEVLAMENTNDEYAFLLDAEVSHVDFSKSVGGELFLDIEVQS